MDGAEFSTNRGTTMKNIFKLSAIAFLSMPVAVNAFPVFIPGTLGVSGPETRVSGGVVTVIPPSSGDGIIVDNPIDLMPLLPDYEIPFPSPTPPEVYFGDPGVIDGYTPKENSRRSKKIN